LTSSWLGTSRSRMSRSMLLILCSSRYSHATAYRSPVSSMCLRQRAWIALNGHVVKKMRQIPVLIDMAQLSTDGRPYLPVLYIRLPYLRHSYVTTFGMDKGNVCACWLGAHAQCIASSRCAQLVLQSRPRGGGLQHPYPPPKDHTQYA
jgi:hypothetical protein